MINILSSNASAPSTFFDEDKRRGRENNLTWLARNLQPETDTVHLLLLGGKGPYDFRLRVAQSHVRHDMTPSHWSHVALLGPPADKLAATPVYEISLDPPGGFGFPAPTNGVQVSTLDAYRSRARYPNIAVLRLPVAWTEVEAALDRFRRQRVVLDAKELMLLWLGFAWGVGRSGNPLLEGHGIPSAAMIEVVVGAAGYDLTPGLESRASCPEAIWQAAKWWHEFYSDQQRASITGAWNTEHYLND